MTTRWIALLLAALVPAAACGDDARPAGDAGGDGTEVDAGSTDQDAAAPDGAPAAVATVLAVGTDFSTAGVASTISVPGLEVTTNAVEGVASTDPVVRHIGDRVYIVNRLGQDNVTVLDAADLTLVAQISTGAGSNPQDVAVVNGRLYVAAWGSPGLVVVDLGRPDDGVIDTIDLSRLDPDGLPNCGTVVADSPHIMVVCGLLDDANFFAPRGPGIAVKLDTGGLDDALEWETPIRPFGLAYSPVGSLDVWVATVDDFSDPAAGGCIHDLSFLDLEPDCLVDNAALGGFASAMAWDTVTQRLWVTVTTGFDEEDFGPIGKLVSVDIDTGEVEPVTLADGVRPMDLALCPSGHLAISDATRGVRVLAPGAEEELTSGPLDIGLPPVSNGLACY
jgi:hypothetical protein